MPIPISLDTDNITLKDLMALADSWDNTDAADLTLDQTAILNLKRVIAVRDQAKNAAGAGAGAGGGGMVPGWDAVACFICATGA